jgi:CBS domain-containing protein
MTIKEIPTTDDPRLRKIVKIDYEQLVEREVLDTNEEVERLILLQSIEGHAHNGHSVFNKLKFVNVDTCDVVRILGLDEKKVKWERQRLIDEIYMWVDNWLNEVENDRLVNNEGDPFLRIDQLEKYSVNPSDVFKGLYLGGLRDDPDVRKVVEEKYNIRIGGGRNYLVDMERMFEMGLDSEKLACDEHEDRIEYYIDTGLILEGDIDVDDDRIRYKYIRHRLGPGQSDDMALIVAGIVWNRDVALGIFLTDAIDTLEKYTFKYQDQDSELSKYIKERFRRIDLTEEDLNKITYLSAIEEGMQDEIPDSSLRYLLSVDKKTGITMLRSHFNFIEGKPYVPVHTSPCRCAMYEFYNYVVDRVRRFEEVEFPKEEKIASIMSPISTIVNKNYTIVNINDSINDVAKAIAKSEVGYAVVFDEKKKVVGIIQAKDILPHLDIRED